MFMITLTENRKFFVFYSSEGDLNGYIFVIAFYRIVYISFNNILVLRGILPTESIIDNIDKFPLGYVIHMYRTY